MSTEEFNTHAEGQPPAADIEERLFPSRGDADSTATPPAAPMPPVTPPPAADTTAYDLRLAENSALSQADVDEVLALAKEKNLTNDQAALLLNQRESTVAQFSAKQQEAYQAKVTSWGKEIQSDKELGGDNFSATLASAKLVMDRFAPEGSKFREILIETGLGNHPELVRFVAAIGRQMGEDRGLGVRVGGGSGGAQGLEESFYPNR